MNEAYKNLVERRSVRKYNNKKVVRQFGVRYIVGVNPI